MRSCKLIDPRASSHEPDEVYRLEVDAPHSIRSIAFGEWQLHYDGSFSDTTSRPANNFRRHQEDRVAPMSSWTIDWFSTAIMFPGWTEYGDAAFLWRGPPTYDPLVVYQPRTWMLREGWAKIRIDIMSRSSVGEPMTAAHGCPIATAHWLLSTLVAE